MTLPVSRISLNFMFKPYILSYIAALGAHRESIQDQAVLKLLDQALDDIQGLY